MVWDIQHVFQLLENKHLESSEGEHVHVMMAEATRTANPWM